MNPYSTNIHFEALDRAKMVVSLAEIGCSDGLTMDCRTHHIAQKSFRKFLREYPELQDRLNAIDWVGLYKPTCARCKSILNLNNYTKFETMLGTKRFILKTRRICDSCRNYIRLNIHKDRIKKTKDKYRNSLHGCLTHSYCIAVIRDHRDFLCEPDFDRQFITDLYNKQKGLCYYSKLPMSTKVKDKYKISIDRVDSSKPYLRDNIVLSCWVVNSMKSNMNMKQFLEICTAVANNV